MTYTILFVIALICVSGFIAYFGDLIGRKMGKKRLTLFNLRPRYTAIVVTTITGMLISALALAALVSVNSQFRKVLLKGEQILLQNKQLMASNMDLIKRSKALRTQVARQKMELFDALKYARGAKKQRDLARLRVTRLKQEIVMRRKELADLRKRTDITQSELDQRKDELDLTLREKEKAEQFLLLAKSQLAEAEKKLGATEARLKDTEAKLAATEIHASMGDLGVELALGLRSNSIVFNRGDELARGVIKPNQSDFALKGDIFSLLDRASERAITERANVGDNGRAVTVIYWPDSEKGNTLPDVNERECIDIIAEKIAAANSDVLVQVVCGMNSLAGSQVSVELRLYTNDIIFKKGDKIADLKIDGRKPDSVIFLTLNDFLQDDLAKTAVSAGLIPATGQGSRMMLGLNRQAQADELFRIIYKIKVMNASTHVRVYAADDIRKADSLNISNIRFDVENAE